MCSSQQATVCLYPGVVQPLLICYEDIERRLVTVGLRLDMHEQVMHSTLLAMLHQWTVLWQKSQRSCVCSSVPAAGAEQARAAAMPATAAQQPMPQQQGQVQLEGSQGPPSGPVPVNGWPSTNIQHANVQQAKCALPSAHTPLLTQSA